MLKNLYKALLITPALLSTLMIVPLKAQQREPLNDVFDRAVFNSSGEYYNLTDISGQANMFFGWRTWPMGSYPENQITEDTLTTQVLLKDTMNQQGGPTIRTRDLVNPYNTSIQENPSYVRNDGGP